jgi:hypothetical protein
MQGYIDARTDETYDTDSDGENDEMSEHRTEQESN